MLVVVMLHRTLASLLKGESRFDVSETLCRQSDTDMVTRQKGPEAVPKAQTPEVQKEDALKASSTNPPTLEGSPVDLKLSTKTPNAMTQEARECEHPLNEAEMNS